MKALIPWREYEYSPKMVVCWTLIILGLVGLAWLVESGEPTRYLAAGGAVAVLVPLAFAGMRYWQSRGPLTTPVAMDASGIFGPTPLAGKIYVPWNAVRAIAHIHSVVGHSRSPIEYNLLLFRKSDAPTVRISLPELTGDERAMLWEVLDNIARLHQIEFVSDHTDLGQKWVQRHSKWFD